MSTAPPPASARSVIETDTFCESCGFNLMTQPVWRDETLGLLVCRCPECGKHHPAQNKTTIGTAWLHRFGTLALLGWMAFTLFVVAATFLGLFANFAAAQELLTYRRTETVEGTLVDQTFDPKTRKPIYFPLNGSLSEPVPADRVRLVRHAVEWLPGGKPVLGPNYYQNGAGAAQAGVTLGLFVVGALVASSFFAAIGWFWRPGRKWAWLVLPPAAFGLMWLVSRESRPGIYNHVEVDDSASVAVQLAILGIQLLAMTVGLAFGRAFARIVLLLFVPPRARQVFAFLWLCDGKTPPPAKTS